MSEEGVVFVRRASGLVREIGPFSALSMVLGHVIGGGINFHSTMDAVKFPGANIPLAFLIAGIPTVLLAISLALMAIMMPRAGGDYIYITRAMDPLLGFIASWSFWFTEAVSFGIIGAFDSIFWGMSIWIYGIMVNDAGAISLGTWMQSFWGQVIVGTILVTIFIVIALFGTKALAYTMDVIVIIPLITGFITIGYLVWGALSPGLATAQFNAIFGSGAWDRVWNVAIAAGYDKATYAFGSNMNNTMLYTIPATWAYIGFTAPAFFGSEVKEPSKSYKIAMIIGPVFIMFYYVVLAAGVWGSYGSFISAYVYASEKAGPQLASALGLSAAAPTPVLPFFAAILAYPNTVMMVTLAVTGAFWLMNDIPAFLMVTSRQIFAWSFDRFFPEFLAAVNDRFHSPHWALFITWIIGIIGVFANAYNWFLAMVGTTVFAIFRYWIDGLTASILPYKRPDIWEKGLRWKWASVPIVTILGIISFIWWGYIFWYAVSTMDAMTAATYAAWWGIGILVFIGYWAYNKSKGIDPKTIYEEVPPL